MRRVDVIGLHVSLNGFPVIAPLICALAWLGKRPVVMHLFGGRDHNHLGPRRRRLALWAIRHVALYLLETKSALAAARQEGIHNVEWFTNYRPMRELTARNQHAPPCRRFVFLSQLQVSKGIHETIAAGERLPDGACVDVYGPFCDGLTKEMFAGLKRVRYQGVLPPQQVIDVLCEYDALILPSYWIGEGYPGVILEAFSAGLPVVTTRWKSIPDLVDESCGILVEPRDADQLHDALVRLMKDDELYGRLCRGVPVRRERFSSEVVTAEFVSHCRTLCTSGS